MANKLETAVCLFPGTAERVVFRLKAAAQFCVLVSVLERTPLNILQLSPFLTRAFFDWLSKHLICPFTSVSLGRVQWAVASAMSYSSRDCTLHWGIHWVFNHMQPFFFTTQTLHPSTLQCTVSDFCLRKYGYSSSILQFLTAFSKHFDKHKVRL